MSKDRKFAQQMARLELAFRFTFTEQQLDLYYDALKEMPHDVLVSAVDTLIRTRTTASAPKVAEIMQAATGTVADRGMEIVMRIERMARKYGSYKRVYTCDPVLNMIIYHYPGGWVALCESVGTEQWPFIIKDLERRYAALNANHALLEIVPASESRTSMCYKGDRAVTFDGDTGRAKMLLNTSPHAEIEARTTLQQLAHSPMTASERKLSKVECQKALKQLGWGGK